MSATGSIIYRPADLTIPIRVLQATQQYSCTYAGRSYEAENEKVLRQLVLGRIQADFTIDWQPVLEFTLNIQSLQNHAVTFQLNSRRFYHGSHHSLREQQCLWETLPDIRHEVCEPFTWGRDELFGTPTSVVTPTRIVCYFAYDERIWQDVGALQQTLQRAAQGLTLALSRAEALGRAVLFCQRLYDHYTLYLKEEDDRDILR